MSGDIKERFLKHRRNTMLIALIALIALFLLIAGGELKKVNVLGMAIEFTQSEMPIRLLMLSLTYMFIKYVQFLHELGGTGILNRARLKIMDDIPEIAKGLFLKKEGEDKGYKVHDHAIIGQNGKWAYTVLRSTEKEADTKVVKMIAEKLGVQMEISFTDYWDKFTMYFLMDILKTTWFGEYVVPVALSLLAFFSFSSVRRI